MCVSSVVLTGETFWTTRQSPTMITHKPDVDITANMADPRRDPSLWQKAKRIYFQSGNGTKMMIGGVLVFMSGVYSFVKAREYMVERRRILMKTRQLRERKLEAELANIHLESDLKQLKSL